MLIAWCGSLIHPDLVSGTFCSRWTKSTVTVDCNAYTTDIKFK